MRRFLTVPVAVLTLLLIGTGLWSYQQYRQRQQLEIFLGNQYNESFALLVTRVENVTQLLSKSIVTTGQEQLVTTLSGVGRESFAATSALNQLPVSNATLEKTSKFLTQVGDFADALARKKMRDGKMSDSEQKKLMSLREQAANLSQGLHDLDRRINDGKIKIGQLIKGSRQTIDAENKQLLSGNFSEVIQKNEPFPTLIYDGPFSDRIEMAKPRGLTGPDVSEKEAGTIAAQFVDYNGKPNLVVKYIDQAKGKVPAYQFSVQPNGDTKDHTSIDISKKGGHPIFYLNPRNVGKVTLSREQALAKGLQFLQSRNFTNMRASYSWIQDGVMTANYVWTQDGVIIYPDQIKLKIALDTGEVIGFEGLGYLMSHCQRKLVQPKVTEDDIYKGLDERYDVESVRLAVIPMANGDDKLTWEARITFNKERYLLYYDAVTGEQINTLRVIDTPDGTFAD